MKAVEIDFRKPLGVVIANFEAPLAFLREICALLVARKASIGPVARNVLDAFSDPRV